MIKILKKYWDEHPLFLIFWTAFIIRLISSVFSQGYLGEIDQFQIIEPAYSWYNGVDIFNLLPWNQEIPMVKGNNMFFLIIHYAFFEIFYSLGINDVKIIFLIIRIIYSFISLITVYYSFLLSKILINKDIARYIAIIFSFFWLFAFLSSRVQAEVIAMPFLMISFYKFCKKKNTNLPNLDYLMTGIFAGFTLTFCFNSLIFIFIFILLSLIKIGFRNWLHIIGGFSITFVGTQGIIDFVIWKKPLVEFLFFVKNYFIFENPNFNDIFKYLFFFLGSLYVLFALIIFVGFIKSSFKNILIALPVFLFFIYCSLSSKIFSVLLILPFIIILGIKGWLEIIEYFNFLKIRKKMLRIVYLIGFIFNFLMLPFFIFSFPNKANVNAFSFINNNIENSYNILIVNNKEEKYPDFYLQDKITKYQINLDTTYSNSLKYSYLSLNKLTRQVYSLDYFKNDFNNFDLTYILIYGNYNLEKKVMQLKNYFPYLHLEKEYNISYFDKYFSFILGEKQKIYLFVNE